MTTGKYLLKCDLIERGWTKRMIDRYYSEQTIAKKQRGLTLTMYLYDKSTVDTIESLLSFKQQFTSTLRDRAEQVVRNRYNIIDYYFRNQVIEMQVRIINAFQCANNTYIKINNTDIDIVLRSVFEKVNEYISFKIIRHKDTRHHHAIIDYIRKHEPSYTEKINMLNLINEAADAYGMDFQNFNLCRHVLKQKVNIAIATTYPFLAKECARQNSLLFRWHPRGDAYRNVYFDYAA